MATRSGVEGIGAGNVVPCLGRPRKPGVPAPMNTCPTPATHVLVCAIYGYDENGRPGERDMVVGMCPQHRPAIEFWAWRNWGELGEGLVVPVEDLQGLMRHLLGDPNGPEIVSPVTGWSPLDAVAM